MHPFIQIFSFKIPSYGLMMAIALTVAILFSYFRAKKAGLDLDRFSNLAIIAVLSGIICSYLLYIFVTYPIKEILASIGDGSFSVFKNGGLVFYGAVIGGFLGAFIYLKIKKQRFLDYAAVIVPSVPLAHAIGRVGCFLAGCCYGKCVDTPISVIYTDPIGGAPTGVPVFPIQLVETFCLLIIFAVLLIYTRRDLKRRSVLFLYMVIYGIERFIIEYFRYDEIRGIFLGLSTSQWISIALVIGGIVGFILLSRAEKNMPAEAAVPTDENSEITDGPNVSADAGEAKPEDGPDAAPADDAEAKPADEAEAKPDDDTKPAPVDEEANGDVTDPVSE